MALTPGPIGSSIATIVHNIGTGSTPLTPSQLQTMWVNIMTAIYNDIKATAQVSSSVTVTSVTGVTTGGGISGPGSGSASGSIV